MECRAAGSSAAELPAVGPSVAAPSAVGAPVVGASVAGVSAAVGPVAVGPVAVAPGIGEAGAVEPGVRCGARLPAGSRATELSAGDISQREAGVAYAATENEPASDCQIPPPPRRPARSSR